jgi:CubicO group peptidase (beta-lactamase class C family)
MPYATGSIPCIFLKKMEMLKKLFLGLVGLITIAAIALLITGNVHVLYGISKTYLIGKSKPDIDDMSYFDVSAINNGQPIPTLIHSKYNLCPMTADEVAYADSLQTTSFLVYKNDSLIFEHYWDHNDVHTLTNSFSMAKSFLALLICKAIERGEIESLDQKVGAFLPEFQSGLNGELTVKHLLSMASGIPFGESYNSPFGYMARAYYGKDLEEETKKYRVEIEPGTLWSYEGGNSVLLGMILKKATGKTPSEYFSDHFWKKIGAEDKAYWNLDHEGGLEKTFSGVYATPRDFAKIGQLMLHDGVVNGDTLLRDSLLKSCITPVMIPDTANEKAFWYGLHWWLGSYKQHPFYSCRGMRGQYIVIVPDLQLVLVRTGHNQCKERVQHMPPDMFRYIEMADRISNKAEGKE